MHYQLRPFPSVERSTYRSYLEEWCTTDLGKCINDFTQTFLHAVTTLVPLPPIQEVSVHRFLVHKNMLCELSGIIVQQITEGVHRLRDGCGKESILFWQIFRKSDKKVKRPGLLLTCESPEPQIKLRPWPTLKDGMSSWARSKDFVWYANFECNSCPRPSASPSLGTDIIHVLWSEGIILYMSEEELECLRLFHYRKAAIIVTVRSSESTGSSTQIWATEN